MLYHYVHPSPVVSIYNCMPPRLAYTGATNDSRVSCSRQGDSDTDGKKKRRKKARAYHILLTVYYPVNIGGGVCG